MEVKTSQKFVVMFHNTSYFKNKIKMNTAAKTILVTFTFWKKNNLMPRKPLIIIINIFTFRFIINSINLVYLD